MESRGTGTLTVVLYNQIQFACVQIRHIPLSGDVGYVVPPVPIPNTVVKHINVESTCLETSWEDRKSPVTKRLSELR